MGRQDEPRYGKRNLTASRRARRDFSEREYRERRDTQAQGRDGERTGAVERKPREDRRRPDRDLRAEQTNDVWGRCGPAGNANADVLVLGDRCWEPGEERVAELPQQEAVLVRQ